MSEHVGWVTGRPWLGLMAALFVTFYSPESTAQSQIWRQEWPATDFGQHTVAFAEIRSGGPSKDGIPAINSPRFEQLEAGRTRGWARNIADNEPVIALAMGDDARAYPVRILIWHEIVNDVIGGAPVVVTYCPLCNAGLVFERSLDDRVLDFGTTGKLRNSDLVMYDRQAKAGGSSSLAKPSLAQRPHPSPAAISNGIAAPLPSKIPGWKSINSDQSERAQLRRKSLRRI